MSNQEPQAFGSIEFKTTFGNLDIELFTKQCPKVTRNFVQLCLDGYYERTLFERVEKDFIAVGGAHADEEEDEDELFPDEFHSRLRFTRRGLLATANVKKDANGAKFFFTLGAAPELQNKHTIFGRVKGNSIYALVDLNECQVDGDLRPFSGQSILKVQVVENPYPELEPRLHKIRNHKADHEDAFSDETYDPLARPKPDPSKAKKLSFYHDDDDDSEDDDDEQEQAPAEVPIKQAETKEPSSRNVNETSDLKPNSEKQVASSVTVTNAKETNHELMSVDEMDVKERRLREIRGQILKLKQQIENDPTTKTLSERRKVSAEDSIEKDTTAKGGQSDVSLSNVSAPRKRKKREQETVELILNFKKKLKQASECTDEFVTRRDMVDDEDANSIDELALLDKVDGEAWLKHKFDAD